VQTNKCIFFKFIIIIIENLAKFSTKKKKKSIIISQNFTLKKNLIPIFFLRSKKANKICTKYSLVGTQRKIPMLNFLLLFCFFYPLLFLPFDVGLP
jgi:hypothetical protein